MTQHDPIKVAYEGLDDLKKQLLNLGIALDNAAIHSTTPAGGKITTGVGDLASYLGESASKWTTGWSMWLAAVSDDASIVGNSIGQASIDFSAVDAAASLDHDIEL